jgi:hypothetical protein
LISPDEGCTKANIKLFFEQEEYRFMYKFAKQGMKDTILDETEKEKSRIEYQRVFTKFDKKLNKIDLRTIPR